MSALESYHLPPTPARGAAGGKGGDSMGITWAPWAKMWRAQIAVNGAHYRIGYYKTMEGVNAAYLEEKRRRHEFCMI